MRTCLALLGGAIFLIFTIILGGLTTVFALNGFYGLATFFGIACICAFITLKGG